MEEQKIRQDRLFFAENLKRLRKSHGLTQEQVVAKMQLMGCNLSRSIYSKIELGTYTIRLSKLKALHDIYNVSYDEFFTHQK